MKTMRIGDLTIGIILASVITGGAIGQESASYPSKPVTVISSSQGLGPDTEMRLYIGAIRQQGGPQYVMDYKIGGGVGNLNAMRYVAKSAPDGYTLFLIPSTFTILPAMLESVPGLNDGGVDNVRDFTHITMLSKRFFMLLVHPDAPFKTFKEYIAYAKAHPGELNWSTSGVGASTHMPGELLHSMTNTKVTFVHYKDSNQRLIDLMAGRVHVAAGTPLAAAGFVRAGKLRAIGITGPIRSRFLPDVPTIAESGLPDYEYATWAGLIAPAKVPAYVAQKNYELLKAASTDPAVRQKLETEEIHPVMSTPDEFRQFIIADNKRWSKVIKEAGIKFEN